MSLDKRFRCLCLLLMTTLTGCASVMRSDLNADPAEAINAIAPLAAGQPSLEAGEAPGENIEAIPESIVETSPDGLLELADNAVAAAVPLGPSESERSVDPEPQSPQSSTAYDPWQRFNRRVHHFNTVVDRTVARPVARAYVAALPAAVRSKVSNFFDNLGQPATAVNALLQGRIKHSAEALGRFLVNSTVGLAGLFDPATRLKMRERDEDLGQTLAAWGWKRSRYLELPFFGPSTVRDFLGRVGDSPLQPLTQIESDKVRVGLEALGLVDGRAHLMGFDALREEAQDDYLLVRDSWTQRREFLMQNGATEGSALPDYLKE
ncbi:MAG: MlaA family lipoprotein [Bradyrhizobium sp.]